MADQDKPAVLLKRNGAAGNTGQAAVVYGAQSDDKAVIQSPLATDPLEVQGDVKPLFKRNGSAGNTGSAAVVFGLMAEESGFDSVQHTYGDSRGNARSDQKMRGGI